MEYSLFLQRIFGQLKSSGADLSKIGTDLMEIIESGDVDKDGEISTEEGFDILANAETEFGSSIADIMETAMVSEESELDFNYNEEELFAEIEGYSNQDSSGVSLTNENQEELTLKDYETDFLETLGEDRTFSIDVHDLVQDTYSKLNENLAEINILKNKKNLTSEEKAKLNSLLNERKELIKERDIFENKIDEQGEEKTVKALEELKKIREEKEDDLDSEDSINKMLEEQGLQTPQNASSAGSASSSSPGPSSGPTNSYTPPPTTDGGEQPKNPEDMSLEELESEKGRIQGEVDAANTAVTDAQTEYGTQQDNLTNAQKEVTNCEQALKDAEFDKEKAEETVQSLIENNEELKTRYTENETALTQAETDLTTAEGNITTTKDSITQKENLITETEGLITTQDNTISGLDNSISDLNQKLQAVKNGDTEESKQAAISQRRELKGQIDGLKQQRQDAVAEKERLEGVKQGHIDDKTKLQADLEGFLTDKENALTAKNECLQTKDTLLAEIQATCPEDSKEYEILNNYIEHQKLETNLQKAQEEVLNCEKNVETARSAIDEAKTNYDTKKAELDKINTLITEKNIKKIENTSEEGIPDYNDFDWTSVDWQKDSVYIPGTDEVENLKAIGIGEAQLSDWEHLTPEMQEMWVRTYGYAKSIGKTLILKSGDSLWRTEGDQQAIRDRNKGTGFAARSTSGHQLGIAMDITIEGEEDVRSSNNTSNPGTYADIARFWKETAEEMGIPGARWGGSDFTSCPEVWHFDLGAPSTWKDSHSDWEEYTSGRRRNTQGRYSD